jgi:hypothetical protein
LTGEKVYKNYCEYENTEEFNKNTSVWRLAIGAPLEGSTRGCARMAHLQALAIGVPYILEIIL